MNDPAATPASPRRHRRRRLRRALRRKGARRRAVRRDRRRPAQLPPVPAAALPGGDRRRCRPPTSPRRSAASCAGQDNAHVLLAKVTGVDLARREVIAEDRRIPFDYLILATGARHAYFGHDDWAAAAPGPEDDRRRHRAAPPHPARLRAAETETDPAERRRLLDLRRRRRRPDRRRDGRRHRRARPAGARLATSAPSTRASARIMLVEAGPRLLAAFDPRAVRGGAALARGARRRGAARHRRHGTATRRRDARRRAHRGAHDRLGAPACRPRRPANWLGAAADRAGRVSSSRTSRVPGHPDIFVIGDTAWRPAPDGKPLPGVAPVAKQQGQYVARLLIARAAGADLPPFRYRDFGIAGDDRPQAARSPSSAG